MNYTDPTEETKEALHIGGVSESYLDFEEENGFGEMNIWKSEDGTTSFEPTREEAKYLNKEQTAYMIKWISYSR
mgnify:CR=1 FL=1|tara:strand:- start:574 stop:795 length:222 start_codon:yes stop_codon:yes gene_type:complete